MSSTVDNTKEVKQITPILQAILLKQIDRVGEALDLGDYLGAFRRLRTLWGRTPPKAKQTCEKEYSKLLVKLASIEEVNGIDIIDTLEIRQRQKLKVLEVDVRPVYDKIVDALYEHGYLEQYKTPAQTNVPPGFWESLTS